MLVAGYQDLAVQFHKESLHFRSSNFREWLNFVQGFY